MIHRRPHPLALGLALLAVPAAFTVAFPVLAPASSAAPSAVQDDFPSIAVYEAAISEALDRFDTARVERLLKDHVEWGQRAAVARLRNLSWNANEKLYEQMKPFRVAWKEAYGNEFLSKVERYLAKMPTGLRKKRGQLLDDFESAYLVYNMLAAKPQGKDRNLELLAAAKDLEEMGDAFLQVGEFYYASTCHYFAGAGHHEIVIGPKDQDIQVVARNLKKFLESRERVDLEDDWTVWAGGVLKELEALGVDPDAGAGEAGNVSAGFRFGAPRLFDGTFTLLEDPTEVPRPSWAADPAFLTWNQVQLGAVGSTTTFNGMSKSPVVKRTASEELEITGTDGTVTSHRLAGKVALAETTIGDPPTPWAFFFQSGGPQDWWMSIQVNLQPTAEFLSVYYLPAGGMTFLVDEVPVTVYDDNGDGVYGTAEPLGYGYVGVTKGEFQPDVDSMVIGKSKRAVPFSEFVQIEDVWYRFEPQVSGTVAQLSPVEELKTGELVLNFDGGKMDPEWVIVRGLDGLTGAFFDLTSSKKVEVPVGRYQLYYGGFRDGKRKDGIQKAIFLPGPKTPTWMVPADGEVEVELGEPFDLDFEYTANEQRVTVLGESLTVTGKAGERYHRMWNLRLQPEILLRKAGKGKGSKSGRMQYIDDQQTLFDAGLDKGWKPRKLEVENRFGTDAVEVQLVEKSSKLFGKIQSSWRAPK